MPMCDDKMRSRQLHVSVHVHVHVVDHYMSTTTCMCDDKMRRKSTTTCIFPLRGHCTKVTGPKAIPPRVEYNVLSSDVLPMCMHMVHATDGTRSPSEIVRDRQCSRRRGSSSRCVALNGGRHVWSAWRPPRGVCLVAATWGLLGGCHVGSAWWLPRGVHAVLPWLLLRFSGLNNPS